MRLSKGVRAKGAYGLKAGADYDAPDEGFPLIAETFLGILEYLRGKEESAAQEEENAARKGQHIEEGEELVVGKTGEEAGNKEKAGKGKQSRKPERVWLRGRSYNQRRAGKQGTTCCWSGREARCRGRRKQRAM